MLNTKKKSMVALMTAMIAIICMSIMICGFTIPTVSAEENNLSDKEQFANYADEIYSTNPMKMTRNMENRDDLFHKLYYGGASDEELIDNGFFVYSEAVAEDAEENDISTRIQGPTSSIVDSNSSSDVNIDAPTITYDATLNEWKISSSIDWKNTRWKTDDLGAQWECQGGKLKRLGGDDLYGFQFNKFTKTFTELGIIRSSAKLETNSVTYYNRDLFSYSELGSYKLETENVKAVGDESVDGAVLFEIPDQLVTTKANAMYYETGYAADVVTFSVNYNSNFAKYDGTVSTFMNHNYETTEISSYTIGSTVNSSGEYSTTINLEFTKQNHQWSANSGTEVTVKKYNM